jgi:ribosomal protein S18 acetylase RimI-like enzyme
MQNSVMSVDAIAVRLARRSEAQVLALMSRDLIEVGFDWTYGPDRIRKLIGDAETVTIVACNARRIVGFAVMMFRDEYAHLALLAVRPANQRTGIGRQLLQWLFHTAATAGVVSIHVELRAANKAAYALYRDVGFMETIRVPGYYSGRETALRMMRMLRWPDATAPVWSPPTLDKL